MKGELMMDGCEYQDVYGLNPLYQEVKRSFELLKDSVMTDVKEGYSALIHRPAAISLRPDVRETHPWVIGKSGVSHDMPDHEVALQGITDIWFDDDRKDARLTYEYPGLVICSESSLQSVKEVNKAKEAFRRRVIKLRKKYRELSEEEISSNLFNHTSDKEDSSRRHREGEWAHLKHIKTLFRKAQIGRICLKHMYRPIPLIEHPEVQRTKHYRKIIPPKRVRTIKQQRVIFENQLKNFPSQKLANAVAYLEKLPDELKIFETQPCSEVITVNYKIPARPGCRYYGWGNQVTGVLPVFCLGSPDVDIQEMVDFSKLETTYEERESNLHKKESSRSKLLGDPIIPGFRLYTAPRK
ncbi:hypothetical protein [Microbulbifer epialgicus]|uniref:Uncharacterized protein n=1 Tax=Microbulbifer epialgicus TaxID=393907 RepID=A0ABV4NV26_9GAMM